MNARRYRALVVDDDVSVRRLTVRALNNEEFICDVAGDGNEGSQMAKRGDYDVVVTDLRMPNRNGHALAVELLERKERPLVVVLTGVIEPRLAKDLIVRGVDDIIWKPVVFNTFAAKVKSMVQRRKDVHVAAQARAQATDAQAIPADREGKVPLAEIGQKLAIVTNVLPISHAAMDVFQMSSSNSYGAERIAAAVARDPSLAAELLRLANGSFYNPSRQRLVNLEPAVSRIGQKRVGELAVAASAAAAITRSVMPWMNLNLTWQRSLAAGVAVELLVAQGGHEKIGEGLVLCTIMNSLGRVVLGSLYPERYGRMVKACLSTGQTLVEQEERHFPEPHTQVLAQLLTQWSLPAEISRPLSYLLKDYSALASLPEPTRTKVELVKLAVLMGHMAVGRWESWDCVEIPPADLLKRLHIHDPAGVLAKTKENAASLVNAEHRPSARGQSTSTFKSASTLSKRLCYLQLDNPQFDFLAEVLKSTGTVLTQPPNQLEDIQENALANCLGTAASVMAERFTPRIRRRLTLVVSREIAAKCDEYGGSVAMPGSYGTLRDACLTISSLG